MYPKKWESFQFLEGCAPPYKAGLQELASLLIGIPFALHEKSCFSNKRTIKNGLVKHLVNFFNMLANNPLCCKWVVALRPFKTRSMHGLDLGRMIVRRHKCNVIPI
jgi:hypothetical protein